MRPLAVDLHFAGRPAGRRFALWLGREKLPVSGGSGRELRLSQPTENPSVGMAMVSDPRLHAAAAAHGYTAQSSAIGDSKSI